MSEEMRKFETGATRNNDIGKLDFEGFLSPLVLERYAEYMNKNRLQSDGTYRDSDNWQLGIPITQYVKSLLRHVIATWKGHRNGTINEDDVCGVIFNSMGILLELIKKK
jgi:hypothetical protein